jgi:cellulase
VTVNLYSSTASSQTTYQIPGPPLYGSGGSGTTVKSSPTPTPSPTSSHTSATPAPTSTTAAGTVAHYGQCGGQGYTGATGCVAPYTCTAQSRECCSVYAWDVG